MLVLCDVLNASDMKPHPTNTRAQTEKVAKKYAKEEMIYGIEQEYTMLKADGSPLGFPKDGFPEPQGPYYCGVGTGRVIGREIIEEHTQACIDAGLMIEGTNAEVMPGQWEFQIGAADALTVSDQLYVARWLLHRIAEDYDVIISFAAKPVKGDWNGAGAHTNFSTQAMREGYGADRGGVQGDRQAGRRPHQGLRRTTSRAASPARTRRPRTTSSATACRTAAPASASRGRSPRTARATPRIAAPTPTATRTPSPASSSRASAAAESCTPRRSGALGDRARRPCRFSTTIDERDDRCSNSNVTTCCTPSRNAGCG